MSGTTVTAAELQRAYDDSIRRRDEGWSTPETEYNLVPGEYEGISGTFANACRLADYKTRKRQRERLPRQSGPARLPQSTVDAIKYILRQPDSGPRLREFLAGRPDSELVRVRAEFGTDVLGAAQVPPEIIAAIDRMDAEQFAEFMNGLPEGEVAAVLTSIEGKRL
jgi:hypothetical protein